MFINPQRLTKQLIPRFALALQNEATNDLKFVSAQPVDDLYWHLWISGSRGAGHWVSASCVLAVFQTPQVAWRGLFVDESMESLITSEAAGAAEIRTQRHAKEWE